MTCGQRDIIFHKKDIFNEPALEHVMMMLGKVPSFVSQSAVPFELLNKSGTEGFILPAPPDFSTDPILEFSR